MPHIAITMYPGRDESTKKELAEKMKQALMEALKVDASVVSVSIEDISPENWENHLETFQKNRFL